MENKNWTYESFPEFKEKIDGATFLSTSGNEISAKYIHDVVYAVVNGVELHLQILRPVSRNSDPMTDLPCVLHVQGSAWMKQDVYVQIPRYARLAERGYVVVVVEYRHCGLAPFPAQAIDMRNAIRFMRLHAEQYGINPNKMIASGDSSGGHTALFAAILQDEDDQNLYPGVSADVRGIINFYGSVSVMLEDGNPSTINHHLPESPEGMEMGSVNLRERPDLCKRMSVEENIRENTSIAPVLIFHGTKDRIVNTKQSVLLYKRLKEVGKEVQFYLLEGADHGGAEFWTPEVLDIMSAFIQNCVNEEQLCQTT